MKESLWYCSFFFFVLRDLPVPGVIRVSCLLEWDWEMRTQTGVHWRLPQWVSSCRSYRTFTDWTMYTLIRFWKICRVVVFFAYIGSIWDTLGVPLWPSSMLMTMAPGIDEGPVLWNRTRSWKKTEVISVHKFLWSLTVFVTLWWLWMSNTIIDNLLRTCMNFW